MWLFISCASHILYKKFLGNIRGQVAQVFDLETFAPHHCGFDSHQGLWIFSFEEAIQLGYIMLLVQLRCLLVPEIMHGGAPEVFFHK